MYDLFIPSSIDLQEIIRLHPPESIQKFDIEICYRILEQIIQLSGRRDVSKRDGFVPLNSEVTRKVLKIRNFPEYRDYLVEHEVIECNWYYVLGKTSYGYRIHRKHISSTPSRIRLTSMGTRSDSEDSSDQRMQVESQYPFLIESLRQVTIDYDDAVRLIIAEGSKKEITTDYPLSAQVLYDLSSATALFYRRYRYSLDGFGSRLHTNLTNSSERVRKFIKLNGWTPSGVDVRNSQLYFANALLHPNVLSGGHSSLLYQLHPSLYDHLQRRHTLKVLEQKLDALQNGQELKMFADATAGGTIYDDYTNTSISGRRYTRDEIKNGWMFSLYSQKKKTSALKAHLRSEFPLIFSALDIYKSRHYKDLAKLLQRIEAHTILHLACVSISGEAIRRPLVTIHDSVYSLPDQIDSVKDAVLEACTDVIGFPPTLKLVTFTDEEDGASMSSTIIRPESRGQQDSPSGLRSADDGSPATSDPSADVDEGMETRVRLTKYGDVRLIRPFDTAHVRILPYIHKKDNSPFIPVHYHYHEVFGTVLCPNHISVDTPCPICHALQMHGKDYLRTFKKKHKYDNFAYMPVIILDGNRRKTAFLRVTNTMRDGISALIKEDNMLLDPLAGSDLWIKRVQLNPMYQGYRVVRIDDENKTIRGRSGGTDDQYYKWLQHRIMSIPDFNLLFESTRYNQQLERALDSMEWGSLPLKFRLYAEGLVEELRDAKASKSGGTDP